MIPASVRTLSTDPSVEDLRTFRQKCWKLEFVIARSQMFQHVLARHGRNDFARMDLGQQVNHVIGRRATHQNARSALVPQVSPGKPWSLVEFQHSPARPCVR